MQQLLTGTQFLSFFRLAIKFTAVAFFLQLVIMLPVHYHQTGDMGLPNPDASRNVTTNATMATSRRESTYSSSALEVLANSGNKSGDIPPSNAMLWLYVMFVYLFSALALYLIVSHTKKIIKIRQAYLGGQSSVTDKTIRLSGIPEDLRSEEKIKETIEDLQIGKVDSVLLCRDWGELDELLVKRSRILRKLEESWAAYLGKSKSKRLSVTLLDSQRTEPPRTGNDEESTSLIDQANSNRESETRPTTRIWYGFMNLQSRKIDALDYYQEKLRKIDEQIKTSRRKLFKPTPLAFVTLDSTAAAVSYRGDYCC